MNIFSRLFGSSTQNIKTKSKLLDRTISSRGKEATLTELRPDLEVFFTTKANLWHSKKNPKGQFPLNMAENNLNSKMMKKKMEDVMANSDIPSWVFGYTGMRGHSSFLEIMAEFMEENLTHTPINPAHLTTLAGATAVIELAAWILCDEGDVAVIPAPSYPVYTQDIFNKAKVERYDLVTHHHVSELTTEHPLEVSHLADTLQKLNKQGKNFKMLILTTPDNPTGHIYSREKLANISQWCIQHQIHLIVNELYGLSQIDTNHPKVSSDYSKHIAFHSFAKIMEPEQSNYLHMIYGLSKDFGISGLRVGFLYSKNERLNTALVNISAPHLVSNYTQWLIGEVFKDTRFIKKYISKNQKKLTASYVTASSALKKINIPFVPVRGSLFIWLEMSEFMKENTPEEEAFLWNDIYEKAGILLTPGSGFGNTKYGQFRLVHSFVKTSVLREAMKRLEAYVNNRRVKI